MDRAAWQLHLRESGLKLDFGRQQRILLGREKRAHGARRLAPPSRDRGGWRACRDSRRPRGASGQCFTRCRAMPRHGQQHRPAIESSYQSGGLAIEKTPQRPAPIRFGRGGLHSVARQMRHQIEIERQLFRRQPLVERQNEATLVGGEEIVACSRCRRRSARTRALRPARSASARRRVLRRRRVCRQTSGVAALPARRSVAPVLREWALRLRDQKVNSSHIGTLSPVVEAVATDQSRRWRHRQPESRGVQLRRDLDPRRAGRLGDTPPWSHCLGARP